MTLPQSISVSFPNEIDLPAQWPYIFSIISVIIIAGIIGKIRHSKRKLNRHVYFDYFMKQFKKK